MDDGNSLEPMPRAILRFNSSESLAHVVENTFVKPELRRQFAVRSFYLYLLTEHPIAVATPANSALEMFDGHDPLDSYKAGIAHPHKGEDLYLRHYPLQSDKIGAAEYHEQSRGLSLLFQLALSEYEKQQLLAPPFNDVKDGAAYVTTQIDERWLIPNRDLKQGVHDLRMALGANHPTIRQRGRLLSSYYATHPTAIVLQPTVHISKPNNISGV